MLLFTFKYIRINNQTQFRVKNCRFVVLNSWNHLMNSSKDWFDWSKLREDSEFVIGFFVKTWNCFFSWKHKVHHKQLIFFWKKITIRIFERKVILFCLHLRLAKVPYGVRTPWYECLSIYIIIRHYLKHFTMSVFVKFLSDLSS